VFRATVLPRRIPTWFMVQEEMLAYGNQ